MPKLMLALASSSCFIMAAGVAQTPPDLPPPNFAAGQGIVLESVREVVLRQFDEMDKNKDGVLSKEELPEQMRSGSERRKVRQELANAQGNKDGNQRPGRPRPPRGPGSLMPGGQSLQALDANQDGQISKEEMTATIDSLAVLDTNKDGTVDRDEMMAMRKLLQGGGR